MKANCSLDHKGQLELLRSVAAIIAKGAERREMLREVLDLLDAALSLQGGWAMLLSTEGKDVTVDSARAASSGRIPPMRLGNGEGVAGRVLRTGQAAVVPVAAEASQFGDRVAPGAGATDKGLSLVCVPLGAESEVVGTLAFNLSHDSEGTLRDVEELLGIVGTMIGGDALARRASHRELCGLEEENTRLRRALGERLRPENIIGNSHAMQGVYESIRKVAPAETSVLIRGESGTGKELVASSIHYTSPRREKPFVKISCGSVNEALLQSELFGHEAGSFTGAIRARVGRIEQAAGGTLFLDEIGGFSPAMQVKLLRLIQDGEFEPIGSTVAREADVRIVAATDRDLEKAIETGAFRQDLYYRINVFPIALPPLRDRKSDILLLADHFVAKYAQKMGKGTTRISTATINMMLAYHWPGNVRELENCIEGALLLSNDGVIHGCHLPPTLQTPGGNGKEDTCSLKTCVNILERDMIMDALKRCKGNISAASRQLGITARMTRYKIKNLDINYRGLFRASPKAAELPGSS